MRAADRRHGHWLHGLSVDRTSRERKERARTATMEVVVTGIVALVKGKAHLVDGSPLLPDGAVMYASAGLCLYFLAGYLKPKCPPKKAASG